MNSFTLRQAELNLIQHQETLLATEKTKHHASLRQVNSTTPHQKSPNGTPQQQAALKKTLQHLKRPNLRQN